MRALSSAVSVNSAFWESTTSETSSNWSFHAARGTRKRSPVTVCTTSGTSPTCMPAISLVITSGPFMMVRSTLVLLRFPQSAIQAITASFSAL